MSFTLSSTNILTDWTCALLPIPLLWSLEMNRNSKIAAGILLSFGVFASVCALVRLQYTIGLTATSDYLYHVSYVLLWAFAEVGVGMTAANCSVRSRLAPVRKKRADIFPSQTLRPVFSKILNLSNLSGGRSGNQSRSGSSGWFSGASRNRRGGAIELDDSDPPRLDRKCADVGVVTGGSRDHSNTRTVEEDSLEDYESARKILGASGRMERM